MWDLSGRPDAENRARGHYGSEGQGLPQIKLNRPGYNIVDTSSCSCVDEDIEWLALENNMYTLAANDRGTVLQIFKDLTFCTSRIARRLPHKADDPKPKYKARVNLSKGNRLVSRRLFIAA